MVIFQAVLPDYGGSDPFRGKKRKFGIGRAWAHALGVIIIRSCQCLWLQQLRRHGGECLQHHEQTTISFLLVKLPYHGDSTAPGTVAMFPSQRGVSVTTVPNGLLKPWTKHSRYPITNNAKRIQKEQKHMYYTTIISGWWFGTLLIFPYIGNCNPNWLSYFSEGWLNHQPDIFPHLLAALRHHAVALLRANAAGCGGGRASLPQWAGAVAGTGGCCGGGAGGHRRRTSEVGFELPKLNGGR